MDGGLVFSSLAMMLSAVTYMYTSKILVDSRGKTKARSYSELGELVLGPVAKVLIDLTIAMSLISFSCSYLYIMSTNLSEIFKVSNLVVFTILFFSQSALSYIRKIQVFAPTLLFGDIMIVIVMTSVLVYGSIQIYENGS